MPTKIYYKYWAKSNQDNQDNQDNFPAYHLLPYHCLDVAAVGKVFLDKHDTLRQLLAKRLGLDETTFVAWQTFFLAIHDLGKFSERFQNFSLC